MKEIPLTKGYVALVDDEDFERLSRWKWCAAERRGGRVYASRAGGRILMHREILGLTDFRIKTDHADRNGLNNQRHNLRAATNQQNLSNIGPKRQNRSGFKGVSWFAARGKWIATIQVNGRSKALGYFTSAEAAAKAYNDAAVEHFGEFAWLNKLPQECQA